MKTTNSKNCMPPKRKSEEICRPVSPLASGKGLPYAPVDWPNPGDVWGWRVGPRVRSSGFFHERYLYGPRRLQERPDRQLIFYSKLSVVCYLQSVFPDADIDAFFASFTWNIQGNHSLPKKRRNMKTTNSKNCMPPKRKSEEICRPVSPLASGKGLPYAPVDWPNPGDVWGWRVGPRVRALGFYHERYLYGPRRLQERPDKQLIFYSKLSVVRYLQSVFPDADIDAFFASFTWKISGKPQSVKKGKCDPCPQLPLPPKETGKMQRGDVVFRRKRKAASKKKILPSSEQSVNQLVLDVSTVKEQKLASGATIEALGSSQVSDSHVVISPDDSACHSPNRKRKSKMLPDTSALVTSPRICGRRRPKRLVDSSYSNAQKRTSPALPSKNQSNARRTATRRSGERIIDISDSDSEVVTPLCEVQEQPKGAMGSSDITSLEELLDSRLFCYYMEHIWSQFSEEKRNPFAHMACMWFHLYAENDRKESVLDWIKKVNVFSKNYVLVPIVLWSHWSLLIFCHFGESLESKGRTPCMLLLDSMRTLDPKRLEPVIRKFVVDIYKTENRPEKKELIRKIPLLIPKVPQQIDDKKCGYFVLYFIKLFILNAPEDFSIHEGYPYFMKEDWFTLEELDNFHSSLASVNVDD